MSFKVRGGDFIVFAPRQSSLSFGSYVNLAVVTQVENKPHLKSHPLHTICTYVASSFPFISFHSILFWILSKKSTRYGSYCAHCAVQLLCRSEGFLKSATKGFLSTDLPVLLDKLLIHIEVRVRPESHKKEKKQPESTQKQPDTTGL